MKKRTEICPECGVRNTISTIGSGTSTVSVETDVIPSSSSYLSTIIVWGDGIFLLLAGLGAFTYSSEQPSERYSAGASSPLPACSASRRFATNSVLASRGVSWSSSRSSMHFSRCVLALDPRYHPRVSDSRRSTTDFLVLHPHIRPLHVRSLTGGSHRVVSRFDYSLFRIKMSGPRGSVSAERGKLL
ncbi:hypothetical protein SAMN04488556_1851 [Halostagnicola kamekurae]|uniref:Uncharacterized protein n=1 Tax=Halostagnicola kamekurae TaxID=619731 RepID=A0A1I6RK87_9EURY|nr:hypothetical protein SAMN04488556_1851 [Halostagnicola kamekurae]